MKRALMLLVLLILSAMSPALAAGKWVATPYAPAKAVFEFYLDDPQKIGSALYWLRALMNPLQDAPYNYSPEDLNIVVVIHGNEIVTVATRNEAKYQDAVDRMRYYAASACRSGCAARRRRISATRSGISRTSSKSCPTPSPNWRTGSSRVMP